MGQFIEASPRQDAQRLPSATRFAVSLLFLLNGILFATWVSRIPAIKVTHGLSHGALGLALLGMASGALVAMPAAGWLSHRFGSARVCAVSAVLYAAGLPAVALAPNIAWLCLILFCFGTAHGALDVAMNAQAVEVEALYRPKPINSSFHGLFSLGGLIGSLAGGLVAAAGFSPWQHFTVVAIAASAAALFLANPRLLTSPARSERREAHESHERKPAGRFPGVLLVLGVIAFCVMLGEGAMADWTGIYLRQVTGSSEAMAAAGYAAFSVAMAAGRFLGDGLATRFGGVTLLRFGGILAAAGLGAALIAAHPSLSIMSFALVGAGFATVVPQVFTAAARVEGISAGPAVAVVATVGYFGFLLGPPLIGFVAEMIGLRGALVMVVIASAVLAALAKRVQPSAARNETQLHQNAPKFTPWSPEKAS